MKKLYKKIIDILHFPREDRLLHFFWGTLIFILLSFIFGKIALLSIIVIAFLKEVHDYFEDGNGFDVVDFAYTIIAPILIYFIF